VAVLVPDQPFITTKFHQHGPQAESAQSAAVNIQSATVVDAGSIINPKIIKGTTARLIQGTAMVFAIGDINVPAVTGLKVMVAGPTQ